jgi:hypothetical protein
MPAMPWTKKFWHPIVLKDGRTITTLAEARAFMVDLHAMHSGAGYWQYAAELLLKAAASGERADIDAAADQFARAASVDNFGGDRHGRQANVSHAAHPSL